MYTDGHQDKELTEKIENYVEEVPADLYFAAAVTSMGTSLGLKLMKKNHAALFFGQWATSFLLLGIYKKLVRIKNSDSP